MEFKDSAKWPGYMTAYEYTFVGIDSHQAWALRPKIGKWTVYFKKKPFPACCGAEILYGFFFNNDPYYYGPFPESERDFEVIDEWIKANATASKETFIIVPEKVQKRYSYPEPVMKLQAMVRELGTSVYKFYNAGHGSTLELLHITPKRNEGFV